MFVNNRVHNTEDKKYWLKFGEQKEKEFCTLMTTIQGMSVKIHPMKSIKPTVPDLIARGRLADLKVQQVPFFKSHIFGVNIKYACTFNVKDYLRYKTLYPNIVIYFWLDRPNETKTIGGRNYTSKRYSAIYEIPFSTIDYWVTNNMVKLHSYGRRKDTSGGFGLLEGVIDDKNNAKGSYVLDLSRVEPMIVLEDHYQTQK